MAYRDFRFVPLTVVMALQVDILEGALDDYSDCTDRGHCFLTGKCRAKCRKRKACRFYTTFTNG
eukprot:SAG31_NODE_30868_length_375_cov_0.735507_2_plen_63_part_01